MNKPHFVFKTQADATVPRPGERYNPSWILQNRLQDYKEFQGAITTCQSFGIIFILLGILLVIGAAVLAYHALKDSPENIILVMMGSWALIAPAALIWTGIYLMQKLPWKFARAIWLIENAEPRQMLLTIVGVKDPYESGRVRIASPYAFLHELGNEHEARQIAVPLYTAPWITGTIDEYQEVPAQVFCDPDSKTHFYVIQTSRCRLLAEKAQRWFSPGLVEIEINGRWYKL